jgi:hypothetical protein
MAEENKGNTMMMLAFVGIVAIVGMVAVIALLGNRGSAGATYVPVYSGQSAQIVSEQASTEANVAGQGYAMKSEGNAMAGTLQYYLVYTGPCVNGQQWEVKHACERRAQSTCDMSQGDTNIVSC